MSHLLRLTFAVFLASSGTGNAQTGDETSRATVTLPEPVELALVVAALTPLGLDDGVSIDRSTPYSREVEAHFGPYRTHPVVAALGTDFNLPRLVGNAADFAFSADGGLVRVDTSGALWGDAAGDLFARHQTALTDFARVTHFRSFYDDHRPVYAALIHATETAADPDAQRRWLEANFDARPLSPRVFVSPLLASHHWTTLYKPEPRIWLSAPSTADLTDANTRLRYARKLFTEVSHQYVNPLTDSLAPSSARAMGDIGVWRRIGASGYASSELRFNEYMTWAAFVLFASDLLGTSGEPGYTAFEALAEEVSYFMVTRRGFVAFTPFVQEALRRYREGATASEVQRAMVPWSSGYASGFVSGAETRN